MFSNRQQKEEVVLLGITNVGTEGAFFIILQQVDDS